MNRTKSLIMGLLLVAAVVALEEWRLAGLRGRVGQLEKDLAEARAAIPPPPRPEPSGEDPGEMLRRVQTQVRKTGEETPENASAAAPPTEAGASAEAGAAEQPASEPVVAAPEPPPEPEVVSKPAANSVRSPANQSLRNAIVKLYASLIEQFQFDAAQAGYFVDLLVESALNRQQIAADFDSAGNDAERAEIQRRAEQTAADIARRMRTFLANDRDYGIYVEYRRIVEQTAGQ